MEDLATESARPSTSLTIRGEHTWQTRESLNASGELAVRFEDLGKNECEQHNDADYGGWPEDRARE
jgi:hypothetical protein